MIMENCRLGGRIEERPGYRDKRNTGERIWTKPHLLPDGVLKKRICQGAACKGCECLDHCGYGKEAVKRGMFDDV